MIGIAVKFLTSAFLILQSRSQNAPVPPCKSEIYCQGPLLKTIQLAKLEKDSKTFVDRKLRASPEATLAKFNELMTEKNQEPSHEDIGNFVANNFEDPGMEFDDWIPEDWKERPRFIDKVKEEEFRDWLVTLNAIWKKLGRKITNKVKANPELYSIIWVPNPAIVPGGRFREFYYWDSYWIIHGLLLSEMYTTVRGMLENFLYIVGKLGHVTNGGRIYYTERSQPPYLIPMIDKYVEVTGDSDFIAKNIDAMETEFKYWMTTHTRSILLGGKNYTLAAYGHSSKGPRPESYHEDYEHALSFKDEDKDDFFSELQAAAEAGWDFSSRWFISEGTKKIDLNSLLYGNAVLLAKFNSRLEKPEKVTYYNKLASEWKEAITKVLWNEEVGIWLDYDLINSKPRNYFFPSNIEPLLTECYDQSDKKKIVKSVLAYLESQDIIGDGGIPTSKEYTRQQWDMPNAWPPLQHIMVMALRKTGVKEAEKVAFEIAETWVRSNYKAFTETESMYEKYDATFAGGHGHGGEYNVQLGFGWTNGVIMDLLHVYGENMTVESSSPSFSSFAQVISALLAALISLIAGINNYIIPI